MGDLLGGIPGLIAELASGGNDPHNPHLHLEMVLSSSELALLPFELSTSPKACPSEGQPLSLHPQLTITRRVRRLGGSHIRWPEQPKILFAAADPDSPIPRQAHLLALHRVIAPWVRPYDRSDPKDRADAFQQHITYLRRASIRDIRRACERERQETGKPFTHVHILAHGVKLPKDEVRYGLVLHKVDDADRPDTVDGTRLACALGDSHRGLPEMSPTVVTIASCDAAQQGSVVGAGSSVAHVLHEAGIPLVVACQFPLSFPASIILVVEFYSQLLWGSDPRCVLTNVRQTLKARLGNDLDWASLVAYASFPQDLDEQMEGIRAARADNAVKAALEHAERALEEDSSNRLDNQKEPDTGKGAQEDSPLARSRSRLRKAKGRLEKVARDAESWGLLASSHKQEAQIVYRQGDGPACLDLLNTALRTYEKAWEMERTNHWVATQYLSMASILNHQERNLVRMWRFAAILAEFEIERDDRKARAWAHGSLAELWMIVPLLPDAENELSHERARSRAEAVRHIEKMVALMGLESFHVFSTRRQFRRYLEWFIPMTGSRLDPLGEVAEAIMERLTPPQPPADR
ncbi:MAG TPA: CHAT domain-containing protein [Acidobacteriota bacterium]|nr:CHAT domain-containing protein [Acidobacteriota bacterium]